MIWCSTGVGSNLDADSHSKLKAFLRKLAEPTVAGLIRALETCAEIFKPSECINYFKSCGYQDDTG